MAFKTRSEIKVTVGSNRSWLEIHVIIDHIVHLFDEILTFYNFLVLSSQSELCLGLRVLDLPSEVPHGRLILRILLDAVVAYNLVSFQNL